MAAAPPRYPIVLSIVAAIVTFAMKGTAYLLTDSVSLLSDAAESLVNLAAALIALVCLWYASRPIDTSHTYGHEKIEYFSSGLEGVLILVAACGIAWYAIERLLVRTPLESLGLGAAALLTASVINLAAVPTQQLAPKNSMLGFVHIAPRGFDEPDSTKPKIRHRRLFE